MPALWRLLDTGPGDAAWNMAVDEALTQKVREGCSRPVLRFYTWVHPAISCGCFQDIERELDLDACRERGVAVVRRPTGGRAVFHGSDLTISLAALESETGIGNDIGETYHRIALAIAWGLRAKGIPVELVHSQASGKEILSSASCFAAKTRHELILEGRKIFGCAQRRWESMVLAQGSLQLWGDGGVPLDLTRMGGISFSSRQKAQSEVNTIHPDQVKEGIAEGFRRAFGIELSPDTLTEEEGVVVPGLVPKYSSPPGEEGSPPAEKLRGTFSALRP